MIEDKIKQEYEWQHREIGQPTLDELFSKINEALGIELWIWQKTYMTMGTYRQMGATTAQCLRVLLFSETTPLDYSSPPRTAREDCERQQLRGLYQDIDAGMITKMSWAFTVAEESYDRETHTRTILKIKKVYDVSAVSIPANNDTEISARNFANRSYEQEKQELLKRRAMILKIKASL